MRRDDTLGNGDFDGSEGQGKQQKTPYDNVHVTPSIAALLCINARAVLGFRSV